MIPLPSTEQLRRLSAFDGDSMAAWRLQSEILHALYGEVSSALVLRPAESAARLVALSGAGGETQIDASDAFDLGSSALALTDDSTAALLATAAPMRMNLPIEAPHSVLRQLLAADLAIALPIHAAGRSAHLLVLGCAPTHALAQAHPDLLGLLANCLGSFLGGALDRRQLAEQSRRAWVEIADLADVQRLLLPDNPQIRGLSHAIHYQPSAVAGGDYYDLMSLSHRIDDYPADMPDVVGLLLADVSGHGAGAAMEAVQFDAILRTYKGSEGEGPAGALTYANRHFFSRKTRPHFLTALGLLYLPHEGRMRLCNAGHLPPLRRRHGGLERLDQGRDIPIGILKEHAYDNHLYDARPGDLLVLYTDGVTEARNAQGKEFGIERLESILARNELDTPQDLLSCMLSELHAHQGGAIGVDDQTLILLRLG